MQAAHRIPVQAVKDFAIRPEVLSRSDNFVWAHQRLCNKSVELKHEQVMWRLMSLGVRELPSFLPTETLKMWQDESKGVFAPPLEPKVKERFVTPTAFPTVTPSSVIKQRDHKLPSGVASPPPAIQVRSKGPPAPSGFPTVPTGIARWVEELHRYLPV